jgi:hypothetical protein
MNAKYLTAFLLLLSSSNAFADVDYKGIGFAKNPVVAERLAVVDARTKLLTTLGAPVYFNSNSSFSVREGGDGTVQRYDMKSNSFVNMDKMDFKGESVLDKQVNKRDGGYLVELTLSVPDQTVDNILSLIEKRKSKTYTGVGQVESDKELTSTNESEACAKALLEASKQFGDVSLISLGDDRLMKQTSAFKLLNRKTESHYQSDKHVVTCSVEIEGK